MQAVSMHAFDPCQLLPVQASDVARAGKSDPEISLAMSYTLNGWPSEVQASMTPF